MSDEQDFFVSDGVVGKDEFNNISDWSLKKFQEIYSPDISKSDIWEYLYGVMHAPDWRAQFKNELQKNLPRIPLAPGGVKAFIAFQNAGKELFTLHADFETAPEAELELELDENAHYRIEDKMNWSDDTKSVLEINKSCRLVGIPPEAHSYQISGRSPLEWAVDSLRRKVDTDSGIVDDPNCWYVWENESYELVRHLKRLAFIGIRTSEIINSLPPSLPSEEI